jgi:hypothetical protein
MSFMPASSKGVNGKRFKGLDLAARRGAAVTALGLGPRGSHGQHDRERGGNYGQAGQAIE